MAASKSQTLTCTTQNLSATDLIVAFDKSSNTLGFVHEIVALVILSRRHTNLFKISLLAVKLATISFRKPWKPACANVKAKLPRAYLFLGYSPPTHNLLRMEPRNIHYNNFRFSPGADP